MSDFIASITSEQLDTDPAPIFARLRSEAPVAFVPAADRWLITRWADVRQVLSGWESFVAVSDSPVAQICGAQTMVANEGDRHAELRSSIDHLFAEEYVPQIVAMTRDVTTTYAKALVDLGSAELMEAYFRPAIAAALGRLVGLDEVEPAVLIRWSEQMMAGFADSHQYPAAFAAVAELAESAGPLLERISTRPDDSLLAHLTHTGCPSGARRAAEDVLPTFANIISTFIEPMHMAGTTLLTLMQHPDQLHTVMAAPERMDDAVREAMRYCPVIGAPSRRTARPVTLGGYDIPVGAFIGAVVASANRDERVYPNPDTFSIDRRPQPNTSLGYGRHRCILVHAMQPIMATCLQVLLEHIGEPRIEPGQMPALHGWKVRKLDALPVQWMV